MDAIRYFVSSYVGTLAHSYNERKKVIEAIVEEIIDEYFISKSNETSYNWESRKQFSPFCWMIHWSEKNNSE